jgi:hypothetical protein
MATKAVSPKSVFLSDARRGIPKESFGNHQKPPSEYSNFPQSSQQTLALLIRGHLNATP